MAQPKSGASLSFDDGHHLAAIAGGTMMNHSGRRTTMAGAALGRSAVLLACLLLPSAAAAELTVPVTVQITELVQLDHDQDPGLFGIGQSVADPYAVVTIDGATFNNFDDRCDNPPPDPPEQSVFDVPLVFFNQDGSFVDPSCQNVPWTFTADVPISRFKANPDGISIRVRILDSDGGLFGGDDDLMKDFVLNVPFGGRWTGAVDFPENCLTGGKADVCFEIEAGADADGDGLLDDWEQHGIDVDGNGTIDLNLPAMGANPMHKDVFVELDWRPGFSRSAQESYAGRKPSRPHRSTRAAFRTRTGCRESISTSIRER
jgi:hypothetical protein